MNKEITCANGKFNKSIMEATMLTLYGYYRSSASYRVRIALNYKNIQHKQESVHLVKNGGEQFSETYQNLNSQSLVPSMTVDGHVFTQSMAILEYLEEQHPEPALLPKQSVDRAIVRAMAQIIACEVHPLDNLRVLKYLKKELNVSDEQKTTWYHHWILEGFKALEMLVTEHGGKCCFGDEPSIADLTLIPQIYNAERFACPLDDFPRLMAVNDYCLSLSAFDEARPENQADAE